MVFVSFWSDDCYTGYHNANLTKDEDHCTAELTNQQYDKLKILIDIHKQADKDIRELMKGPREKQNAIKTKKREKYLASQEHKDHVKFMNEKFPGATGIY